MAPLLDVAPPLPDIQTWLDALAATAQASWQPLPLAATLPFNEQLKGLLLPNEARLPSSLQWYVHPKDARTMVEMRLGALPLSCIALPWFPKTEAELLQRSPSPQWMQVAEAPTIVPLHQQLSQFFPVKFVAMLYELQSLFAKIGVKGYLIGGLARDLVFTSQRSLQIRDIDITLEGPADEIAQAVMAQSRNFTVTELYPAFGTAKLSYKGLFSLDFASTRLETYAQCGAMPVVLERGVPLQQDIQRRDFTLNTLALSVHHLGELLDYTDGLASIEAQEIEVLHAATFFEDPSRGLRAFKFANRLQCGLSLGTRWLLYQCWQHLPHTSFKGGGARVALALKEWLALPPTQARRSWLLYWMQQGGLIGLCSRFGSQPTPTEGSFTWTRTMAAQLLQHWETSLAKIEAHWSLFQHHHRQLGMEAELDSQQEAGGEPWLPEEYLSLNLSLLSLLEAVQQVQPAAVEPLLARLECTKLQRQALQHYHTLLSTEPFAEIHPNASILELYQAFRHYKPLALLAWVLQQEDVEAWLLPLQQYLYKWRWVKPRLNGDALAALGVPKGNAMGQCLTALKVACLNKQLHTLADEEAFVKRFLITLHPPETDDAFFSI